MCQYCMNTGVLNLHQGDIGFIDAGILTSLINTTYCPYCNKGRDVEDLKAAVEDNSRALPAAYVIEFFNSLLKTKGR